jgi:amino acid transporter
MPLAFAAIIGFVMIGIQNGGYDGNNNFHWFDFPDVYDGHLPLFADRLPFIGVMSSVPAVFFAFDGFYSAAGVQSEMKEPRKVSMALAIGIAIVAAIDVIISFSLLLGTDTGRMSDLLIPR